MDKTPEVSIVMPVYNVEKYAAASLDSVLEQTFKNFELICINDASTDGSWKIVLDAAARDSRVRLLENERNSGLSVTRNIGLEAARGKYVMFVDSDDFIHPQTLEIALHFAERCSADIIGWYIRYLWDGDSEASRAPYEDFDSIPLELTPDPVAAFGRGTMNSSCNKLIRARAIGKTRFIPGVQYEDNAFVLELLYKNPKTAVLSAPLYNYVCYNCDSITKKRWNEKTFADYGAVFRRIHEVWKDEPADRTRFITDHLFKESKNFMRGLRRHKYSESVKRAFADMIADMDAKGWLKMPKGLRKIDKIKHLIRLKYYIMKHAGKGVKNA